MRSPGSADQQHLLELHCSGPTLTYASETPPAQQSASPGALQRLGAWLAKRRKGLQLNIWNLESMLHENSQAWIDNHNFYNFLFYLDLKYFSCYICSHKSLIQKWTKYKSKCLRFHSGACAPADTRQPAYSKGSTTQHTPRSAFRKW